MTRQISDIDRVHVVPLDPMSLADAFAYADASYGDWRLKYASDDMPLVSDGDLPTLEVLEEIPGGCLIRVGALVNDPAGLASFLEGRDGPATLQALEQSIDRTERFVEMLGGHAAMRSKGRWRPIDAAARPAWGAHLVRWNTQQLRARAAYDRMQRPYRQAAGTLARTLKAA